LLELPELLELLIPIVAKELRGDNAKKALLLGVNETDVFQDKQLNLQKNWRDHKASGLNDRMGTCRLRPSMCHAIGLSAALSGSPLTKPNHNSFYALLRLFIMWAGNAVLHRYR
jgi:hypothetical protein